MDKSAIIDKPHKATATNKRNGLALEMFLVVAIVITFFDVVKQGFVGDDWFWLYNAKFTMSHLSGWVSALEHANGSGQYRPLTQNIFFWCAFRAFGLYAPAYHIVMLVVFSLSALILFRLVTRLVKDKAIALGATMFFAVSPLHYGGLSWVSAFSETGAIFCFILALYFITTERHRLGYLAYIVCLLSNETASIVPAIGFLYYTIYKHETLAASARKTLWYWAIFVLYMILRVTVLGLHPTGVFTFGDTFGATAYHIAGAVVHVVGVAPTFYNVTTSSGAVKIVRYLVGYFYFAAGTVLLISIVRRSITDLAARNLVLFGGALFIVGLLPELMFAQHDWALYNLGIPNIGVVFIAASLGIGDMSEGEKNRGRRYVLLAAGLLLLFSIIQIWGPGGLNDVQGSNVLGRQVSRLYKRVSIEIKKSAHKGQITLRIVGDKKRWTSWMLASPFGLDVLAGTRSGSRVCYSRACRADITVYWNAKRKQFENVSNIGW